jgi:predicted ATPase
MKWKKGVLTGGPSVGKTTCLGLARAYGCQIVPEQATVVIKEGKHLPWDDHIAFQWEVLCRQIEAEQNLSNSESPVLLDRGLYDAIAYRLVHGWKVQTFLRRLRPKQYDIAFVFPALNHWHHDGIRYEDPHFAREITPYLIRVYEDQGIPVVKVPEGTPEERTAFILRHFDWLPNRRRIPTAGVKRRSAVYLPLLSPTCGLAADEAELALI